MAAPVNPVTIGLIGLMAWGVYRRIRRNIGRQPLRTTRIIISLVILSLITGLLVFVSLGFSKILTGILCGLLLGAPLGFWGLRLTKFETTDEGHFYIPNTHIGIVLSVLVAGRMIYRMWQLNAMAAGSQPQMFQSPLTMFILGLTLGYYLVYRIGLLVHTHDKKPV